MSFDSPSLFADPGCAQGVVSVGQSCLTTYRYAVRRTLPDGACNEVIEEVCALEPHTGDLYPGEPGNCTLTSPPARVDLFRLGPDVPLSSFPEYVQQRGDRGPSRREQRRDRHADPTSTQVQEQAPSAARQP